MRYQLELAKGKGFAAFKGGRKPYEFELFSYQWIERPTGLTFNKIVAEVMARQRRKDIE